MRGVVVDASVAAKWVLPSNLEPYSESALLLLNNYAQGQLDIVVPDLFWAEIGNVLWKAARTRRLTLAEAKTGLGMVADKRFQTVPSLSLLDSALEIAIEFGRSFYDCLYVALAETSGAELVTADEKLVNVLGRRFPLKWLGSYHG
ncbi:MAG: type II toxin-antitoxin system VapC family toxin [Candidatus Acidiferrales bacterium]